MYKDKSWRQKFRQDEGKNKERTSDLEYIIPAGNEFGNVTITIEEAGKKGASIIKKGKNLIKQEHMTLRDYH